MKKVFLLYSLFWFGVLNLFNTIAQTDYPCTAPFLVVSEDGGCNEKVGQIIENSSTNILPNCGDYVNNSVWYRVIVPSSGVLKINVTNSNLPNAIYDPAISLYKSSNCSDVLTLIACDDDGGVDLMPSLYVSDLTVGDTLYVQIWKNGGGVGSFNICASSPNFAKNCIGGNNASCATAQPFCTAQDVTYCNISSSNLGSYSCLYSTPNAMWLYLEVAQSGSLSITIRQTSFSGNLIDVDFALYGPYTSLAAGCSSIGPNTPTVSCSYSASATETATVPNAIAGQIYVMLVTNYNGALGQISFTNNPSSTGATSCAIVPCTVTASMTPDICSTGAGSVTATPQSGDAPFTFSWNIPGSGNTQTVTGVLTGTYTVDVVSADGRECSTTVTVADNPVGATSSSTLVSCAGGSDGTATANMVPAVGTITYQWDDASNQTTQTAVGLSAGTYTCVMTSSNGCVVTTSVTVNEIPAMQANINNVSHVTCNSLNDGAISINVVQGTAPYTFVWDNSSSTTNTASNLYAGIHSVTITDNNGCTIDLSQVINEPDPLSIIMLTPDTQICPEDNIQLNVVGSGGSSGYIYNWYSNGVLVGTGNSITVDPEVSNTQYCVELSEICGSPSVDSCLVITFPTPIPPSLLPDKYESCMPGSFVIQNVSSNILELATTYIDFGNNDNAVILNGDDITYVYGTPGVYTFTVVNTSIYGCVYEEVFEDFLIVHPDPIANFYIAGNPTTIFETSLTVHELATDDVVQWDWYSPYSQPIYSNLEHPKFTFPEGVEGVYPITLIVTSHQGCKDTITMDVIVEDAVILYAPNAFTPDDDEFNQLWKVYLNGGNKEGFNLKIFNRWGEIVWETNDPNVGWDGTYNGVVVQDGVLTWTATVKNRNNDGRRTYNGMITLIR